MQEIDIIKILFPNTLPERYLSLKHSLVHNTNLAVSRMELIPA